MQRQRGATLPPPFLGVNTQNNDSRRPWCRLFCRVNVHGLDARRLFFGNRTYERGRCACGQCPDETAEIADTVRNSPATTNK
jgi:hypothetical protein